MEAAIHRFVRLLRLSGLRISVSEALDAMRCATQPGMLGDRETLRCGLRVALVKDRRDLAAFEAVFDAFFSLIRVGSDDDHGHSHSHDDLVDSGQLESFTMSDRPSENPQQTHEHGPPADIRDYFDPDDLAQQFNLHQEANKIDLAALTDELVFAKNNDPSASGLQQVQLETDHLHGAGAPGRLSRAQGTKVDADLTVAQQEVLLAWLNAIDDEAGDDETTTQRRLAGALVNLPEAIKRHLEALMALEQRIIEGAQQRHTAAETLSEAERAELEESLRRVTRTFHGALTSRLSIGRGRIDPCRTMRRNMRYDGIPFAPVMVRRTEDRPRLVVLADVSLSVRATARFTLHLVHGLQHLFSQVRSFAFVADMVEVTDLFTDYTADDALSRLFGGEVLDVDANSDYGLAFGEFVAEHLAAVTRRTTVLVLGDGRGNGNDANLGAFETIARRAREVVWLTPEPRYSWKLGGCDLPAYAQLCSRVEVVRDLSGLERAAFAIANREGVR
ncbi:VWA domain-containing protein [Candidatus Mycolicibacterium alkanivorans]|uniref:VWA domain-containing protein n=1 Tax=Candidatus Mycolicibacterium alkanivorans TaxID=2954114 RepID=A0ABS9Z1H6_9MYCO|nr:VWA domain-containing protein [Candidatus Mycolicibacterium alkanivorans]MCI4676359.1 VWA domain-containing protein [Candidatus Mycolicibacterium alkanivorans]